MKITALVFFSLLVVSSAMAQSGKDKAASTKSDSTGFATCDKYIRMVTECITTRVPQDKRLEERQRLDSLRSTLSTPLITSEMANGTCEGLIHDEMQSDTYGCYTKQAEGANIKTPCSFITSAEVQAVLKAPFKEGQRDGYQCLYPASGSDSRYVSIEMHWSKGKDELDAARWSLKAVKKRAQKDAPTIDVNSLADGETISGLGDDSFFMTAATMRYLYVRKGDASFTIEAFGLTREQMIAIARKILPRFP